MLLIASFGMGLWLVLLVIYTVIDNHYYAPPHRAEELSDDACMTSVCRVHLA